MKKFLKSSLPLHEIKLALSMTLFLLISGMSLCAQENFKQNDGSNDNEPPRHAARPQRPPRANGENQPVPFRSPFKDAVTEKKELDLLKLEEIFKKADSDNDGFLDKKEQNKSRIGTRSFKRPDKNRSKEEGRPDNSGPDKRRNSKKNSKDFKDFRPADNDRSLENNRRPDENNRRPGENGNFLKQAQTQDGKIDLSKLPAKMPAEMKANLTKADLDNDGFLDQQEQKNIFPRFNERMPSGKDLIREATDKEGKIEIAKVIDSLKVADTDQNNLLTSDEFRKAKINSFIFGLGDRPQMPRKPMKKPVNQ